MTNSFERFFGEHTFEGCKIGEAEVTDLGVCNTCLFCIDGETYRLAEDECDGYRSYCKEIEISEEKIKPEFSIRVVCTSYDDDEDNGEYYENDCMKVIDIINGKTILVIGTKNVKDYYPFCCFDYRPQNINLNDR